MEEHNSELMITAPAAQYSLQTIRFIRNAKRDHRPVIPENFYALLLVTRGRGSIHMKGEAFAMGTGKCFLLRPEASAALELEGEGISYYLLIFGLQSVKEDKGGKSLLPAKAELACTPFARVLELIEDIYGCTHEQEELRQFHCYVRFQELLLLLISQNQDHAAVNGKIGSVESEGIDQSIRHIQQHYRNVLTVEELADLAGIDRWKYTRLFKEKTGLVPLQYLNGIRIEQAKRRLTRGEERLSEVAEHAGFTNEYYFNRRFKQMVGVSPGQFRRSHRDQPRVAAPFLEDFLVALDILPIVQYSHAKWGKQDYLALHHVPTFDELSEDFTALSAHNPDFIILRDRYENSEYVQCRSVSPLCVLDEHSDNWRALLRMVGSYVGRSERAEEVIAGYEAKASEARTKLSSVSGETVAFLRISADFVHQYTDTGRGFATAVLYGDLGLCPHRIQKAESGGSTARMTRLSLDELSMLTADHLFVTFDKWHSQADGEERALLQHPLWSALPAVRNNRVYEVDFMTWMNYGVISNTKKIDDILHALA
ncbi:helix-turn-helix domain-containing protein [Paenibacillus sp. 2TAB23]|uniref:helix-turn-helix domain-containing protein n=1 Tax=Paenibacillus sp. 2TAB23 TaxID=3233004 RepID=UPI003F99765F